MTIQGPTGGKGTRALARRYPAEDGIIGGTTSQTGHKIQLEPRESKITKIERQGIR